MTVCSRELKSASKGGNFRLTSKLNTLTPATVTESTYVEVAMRSYAPPGLRAPGHRRTREDAVLQECGAQRTALRSYLCLGTRTGPRFTAAAIASSMCI